MTVDLRLGELSNSNRPGLEQPSHTESLLAEVWDWCKEHKYDLALVGGAIGLGLGYKAVDSNLELKIKALELGITPSEVKRATSYYVDHCKQALVATKGALSDLTRLERQPGGMTLDTYENQLQPSVVAANEAFVRMSWGPSDLARRWSGLSLSDQHYQFHLVRKSVAGSLDTAAQFQYDKLRTATAKLNAGLI